MTRPDNENVHRYGAYDYRTVAEDRRRDEADKMQRAQSEANHRAIEDINRRMQERNARDRQAYEQRAKKQRNDIQKNIELQPHREWSTGWAIFGFIVAAGFTASQYPDSDGSAMPMIIVGFIGAFIAGRYYKFILGLLSLGVILWIFSLWLSQ